MANDSIHWRKAIQKYKTVFYTLTSRTAIGHIPSYKNWAKEGTSDITVKYSENST